MGNGTLKGTIVKGGAGGSGGGGTAATTSFAPTATITSDNVQDAVEEVDAKAIAADAKAEAVAGDLSDTEINGVAIAGKNNTCADLGIQGKLTEGSGIQIDEVVTAPVKFLMSTKNDVNFPVEDISGAPLGFLQMNPTNYVLGPELYANSTIKSIGAMSDYYNPVYISKGSFDWSKLNMGTGPFTVTFRRLLTKDNIYPTNNYIIYSDRRGSSYDYGIRSDGSFWCDYWNKTAGIPIIKNVIEEIKLTRLEDGTYEWYKNGTKLGTDQNILKGLTVDFSFGKMLRLGDHASSFETVGFFISGLTITNTPYTGGNYTLSKDYPTTGVIVTTNTISAVASTLAFDNTNTGISATNVQDAIEEVDNKLTAKANLVDGKVPLTELPELGGAAPISEEFGTLAPASSTRFWAAMDADFKDSQNKERVFENHGLSLSATKTPPYGTKWIYKSNEATYGRYLNIQNLSPRKGDFVTDCWFYGFTGGWSGNSLYKIEDKRKANTLVIVQPVLSAAPNGKYLALYFGNGVDFPTVVRFHIPDDKVINEGYAPQYLLWGRQAGKLVAFFNGTKLSPVDRYSDTCTYDFNFSKDSYIDILNQHNIYEVCFGRFGWALKAPPSESFTNPTAAPVLTEDITAVPCNKRPVDYRQIASKTCTSTSETSLIDDTGAKGTNVIPANTLQVGDVIMIDIEGQISGLSAATATLNIKYGSTVIATLAKPFTDTYTGIHFDVKATATVRAIGATGKLVLSGLVYLRNRSVQGSGITWPIGGTSEVTIDTTAESALDATIAWSAENAGNTITASQFVISSLLR